MRTSRVYAVLSVALAGVACSDNTTAPTAEWTATMDVAHEVPGTVVGTSTATGTVVVSFSGGGASAGSLTYTLTIAGAPTSAISAAHIHGGTTAAGAAGTAGSVRVNLCGAPGITADGRTSAVWPVCPPGAGTTGSQTVTWPTGATLVGGTGLTFDQLVAAVKASNTYANVHTANNAGGEIRGQLLPTPGLP